MDDVLKRLGAVESAVSDIKAQVSGLTAIAPHLATKADVAEIKTEVARVDSSLIKWIVGTLLALALLTFTIARFVKVGS